MVGSSLNQAIQQMRLWSHQLRQTRTGKRSSVIQEPGALEPQANPKEPRLKARPLLPTDRDWWWTQVKIAGIGSLLQSHRNRIVAQREERRKKKPASPDPMTGSPGLSSVTVTSHSAPPGSPEALVSVRFKWAGSAPILTMFLFHRCGTLPHLSFLALYFASGLSLPEQESGPKGGCNPCLWITTDGWKTTQTLVYHSSYSCNGTSSTCRHANTTYQVCTELAP
ncbi:uncharacterized protein LOC128346776 [Hemicordylus capensis]|uniref:uncharacterized protein LOC128346776 n=1 Tax=Hemicordylus capensis TaxID=884348 RepID=UPI0023041A40|nr:uncharacterized protein LOC128346776 [Hemicordylus capensis]